MIYVLIKAAVEYQRNDRIIVRVKNEFFKALVKDIKRKKAAVVLDTGAEITIPLDKIKGIISKNPKMFKDDIPKVMNLLRSNL